MEGRLVDELVEIPGSLLEIHSSPFLVVVEEW